MTSIDGDAGAVRGAPPPALDVIDAIRRRPGMYVGGTDATGLHGVVMGVIGNAFDQHLAGRCTRIDVRVDADGWIEVADDGPGMTSDAEVILRRFAVDTRRPTEDGHRPHVHLEDNAFSLVVVCALAEVVELTTVRAGVELRARWRRGRVELAPTTQPSVAPTGTRLRWRADPEIFGVSVLDLGTLMTRLDELAALAPGLAIGHAFEGVTTEPRGLAGWVARTAEVPLDHVIAARVDTTAGDQPLTVDVAVAWPRFARSTMVSYVNYQRSRDHGVHVDGVFDGLARALDVPRGRIRADHYGAVAVVLADVHFGNPTRDRLVSPAVRPAVAAVVAAAVRAWTAAHPDAAVALRTRLGGR